MATLFKIIGIDYPSSPRTLSLPAVLVFSLVPCTTYTSFICFVYCVVFSHWNERKAGIFVHVVCPLLYPQHLVQCLAHSRSLINICHILES